jgi:hypothetical protein
MLSLSFPAARPSDLVTFFRVARAPVLFAAALLAAFAIVLFGVLLTFFDRAPSSARPAAFLAMVLSSDPVQLHNGIGFTCDLLERREPLPARFLRQDREIRLQSSAFARKIDFSPESEERGQ